MPVQEVLSPLGVALEGGRRATGLATETFLRRHRLYPAVWARLKYGRLTPSGGRPQDATVIRYAAAAGVDKSTALALAEETFGPVTQRAVTKLGAALERAQRLTGESLVPFLASRGLSITTWYRLLGNPDAAPNIETVIEYATAVELPIGEALDLAAQDSRSRQQSTAAITDSPDA